MTAEIYKHRARGALYQVLGRCAIDIKDASKFKDGKRVAVWCDKDQWHVSAWMHNSVEDITTAPTGHVMAGRLQVSTGYKLEDGSVVVVYRGEDASIWVRLEKEFMDGRFEKLSATVGYTEPTLQELTKNSMASEDEATSPDDTPYYIGEDPALEDPE